MVHREHFRQSIFAIRTAGYLGGHLQPIDRLIVREAENELVDHSVDAHSSTDKLHGRILGVAEDEVVTVEVGETISSYATSHGRNLDGAK